MLQENPGVRLAFKAYASGSMTANTEADTASAPGASSAQELRRVSSTLSLAKDSYQSNEVRTDRQVSDMRHGVVRVGGEISGELSPGTYWDLMEAVLRGTEVAEFSRSNTEFTSLAADNTTSKFTVGASTWAAQGFFVGDVLRPTNLSDADNNSKNFLITSLSGVDAFVTPAPDTMGADTSFTVTRTGKKVSIPTSSHVKRLFAFEHYHQDLDIAQLFTECRVSRMQLSMPATGLCTVSFGVTGRGMDVLETSAAPYFTSPTAATTTGLTAAVNGKIVYEGATVGVITGVDLTIDNSVDAPAVAGQNFVPDILLGRTVVNGNLTALFESAAFLTAFSAETEVELLILLTTTSAADSPFIAITLPRVKFSGANLSLQGEAGLPISLPFQALIMPSTTGYPNSTVTIQDSAAA